MDLVASLPALSTVLMWHPVLQRGAAAIQAVIKNCHCYTRHPDKSLRCALTLQV